MSGLGKLMLLPRFRRGIGVVEISASVCSDLQACTRTRTVPYMLVRSYCRCILGPWSPAAPSLSPYYSHLNRNFLLSPYSSRTRFRDEWTVVGFHWTPPLCDDKKPSSKLETAVNALKEEGDKKNAAEAAKSPNVPPNSPIGKAEVKVKESVPAVTEPAKLTLWQRIKNEATHYYHGFRLLFLNVRVSKKYVKKVLRGETLSRRENQQLVRTVSDLFRLVPFSIFIIVPFMEFLLPVALWLFPNMLPSTFESQNQKEEQLKKTFRVKLKMAKFLQVTLDEMAAEAKRSSHESSDKAKELVEFFQSVRQGGGKVDPEKIIKFSKLFEDELTLDSLGRGQLVALCRMLELQPIGTQAFLRWQLRMRLRSLKADDQLILKEGVDSLTVWELQQACKARGMKAFGVSEDRMRLNLSEWLALSLNEKVPTSLLLLSRALYIPDDMPPEVQLEATISQLPESVARKAKVRVDEKEGKMSYKDQYDIVKEEEAIIEQEREERRLEDLKLMEQAARKIHMPVAESILGEGAKAVAQMSAITGESTGAIAKRLAQANVLKDKAPTLEEKLEETKKVEEELKEFIDMPRTRPAAGGAPVSPPIVAPPIVNPLGALDQEQVVSREVLEHLEDAIEHLQTEKQKAVQTEREKLEAIKQEILEYSEDVKNLEEIAKISEVQVKETRAAKILHKKVQSMIKKMDRVVNQLEKGKVELESQIGQGENLEKKERDLVRVEDLLKAIGGIQKVPDEALKKRILDVIHLFDEDQDGAVDVKLVVRVLELLGKENVKLSDKMIAEIVELVEKEEILDELSGTRPIASPSPSSKQDVEKLAKSASKSSK